MIIALCNNGSIKQPCCVVSQLSLGLKTTSQSNIGFNQWSYSSIFAAIAKQNTQILAPKLYHSQNTFLPAVICLYCQSIVSFRICHTVRNMYLPLMPQVVNHDQILILVFIKTQSGQHFYYSYLLQLIYMIQLRNVNFCQKV